MPYTGAGVNPIRAFGPAAITGNLVHEHWVKMFIFYCINFLCSEYPGHAKIC